MIRLASVLALGLISVSAYATPKLGDFAQFDLTVSLNGESAQGEMVQEIVQANGDQFLERNTVTFPGQAPEVTDNWKPTSEFMDDSTIDAILGNCEAAGGSLQNVSVPAGTFTTCALNFDNEESRGIAWVAKVPFGVARLQSTIKANNVTVDALLRSFR